MGVYLIHAEYTRYFKVGFTSAKNASSRRKSLQTASPHNLKVVGWFKDGTRAHEKELQALFSQRSDMNPFGMRTRGEWFFSWFVIDAIRLFKEYKVKVTQQEFS